MTKSARLDVSEKDFFKNFNKKDKDLTLPIDVKGFEMKKHQMLKNFAKPIQIIH